MKSKDKKEIREERITSTLNKIIELFKTGDVPKAIAMVTFPPYQNVPSATWSLCNRIIMIRSDTSDARGYDQFKKAGRQVKKGAKSFHILAPKMVKKRKNDQEEPQNDSKETQEKPEYFLAGFVPIPVFKVEDTEGDDLEYEPYKLPEFPLMEKAREWGIQVKAEMFVGTHYGSYQYGFAEEKIRLATPHESVFFHELAHSAHRRVKGNLSGRRQDPTEEIVAEFSALALGYLVGTKMETVGNSYRYIERYAKGMNKDIGMACMGVLADVEKVLSLILATETVLV